MYEWMFRAGAVAIAIIAYAINLWLFVAVCLAFTAWYGWHSYTHGYAPGGDPDPLNPTLRGNLNKALVSAGITAALVIVVPVALFAAGIGHWATFVAAALAILAGVFVYLRLR